MREMKIIWIVCLFALTQSCKTTTYVSEADLYYERVSEASEGVDPEVEDMIEPYRVQLDAVMNEVLGNLEETLTKKRPESNIGNWLADMLYDETKALNGGVLDFAIQNHGGVRVSSLSAGPITRGEVIEVMPFDNKITIITADGKQTQAFLDHIAKGKGWPISQQLRFKIKDKKATEVLINGEPIDMNGTYHFAVPDYIAGGGSGSDMLKGLERKDLNVLIRDCFIDNIKKDTKSGLTQAPVIDGRLVNLDHE